MTDYAPIVRDAVLEHLRNAHRALADLQSPNAAVHRARKHVRVARSLLRSAGTKVDGLKKHDRALQQLNKQLSKLRDLHVATEQARTVCSHLQSLEDQWLTDSLAKRRDTAIANLLASDPGLTERRKALEDAAVDIAKRSWADLTESVLNKSLRQSGKRLIKAVDAYLDSPNRDHLHRIRRRARRLRMQMKSLQMIDSGLLPGKVMGLSAKFLHKLTDAIGEVQDLKLLKRQLRSISGEKLRKRTFLLELDQSIELAEREAAEIVSKLDDKI